MAFIPSPISRIISIQHSSRNVCACWRKIPCFHNNGNILSFQIFPSINHNSERSLNRTVENLNFRMVTRKHIIRFNVWNFAEWDRPDILLQNLCGI